MKKAVILNAIIFACLMLSACGGSSPRAEQPAEISVSKIAKRVLLLNQFAGKIQIIDAATDTPSAFFIPDSLSVFSRGEFLLRAGTKTLLLDSGPNVLYVIDSAIEGISSSFPLDGPAESVAVTGDGNTAYIAIPSLGRIQIADLAGNKFLSPINGVPGVRRLVVTKNGAKLLAFANDVNTMVVINIADKTGANAPIGGFDRPYTAVISSDDSKAFILSCGGECGGAAAKVTVLDLSNNAIGSSVFVGGATVGLLEGTNLYVAGSPATSTSTTNGGTFNIVSVSNAAALTASANIAISDGLHHTIVPVSSSKLYIGATRCTIVNSGGVSKGCLSIVSGTSAVIGAARGEVTSIAAIKNRTVAYVTQGGDLDIYDTTSDALQTKQIDITGRVVDAKEID